MTPADPQLLTPALIRRTLTYRWVCLGLLFVSGLLAFFTRLAPAVVIPDLREAFVLNAAELGLLTSLYLWPFALMQPVAGVLTDRFGSRRAVTAFLVVAGVGQVLFAFAPSFLVALIGRAPTGLGASILYVGAAKIMAQWFLSAFVLQESDREPELDRSSTRPKLCLRLQQGAVFAINGPISAAPAKFLWFREAKAEFFR